MDGAGEDFCNEGMIAMLKYSNHFLSVSAPLVGAPLFKGRRILAKEIS
jgi:hypothetical protein